MAIVKMKHLQLIAMRDDQTDILRQLQRMGCVEIDEARAEGDEDPSRQALLEEMKHRLSRPDDQAFRSAQERRNAVVRSLETLKRYAPDKTGFLTPKPDLTETQLFEESAARAAWSTTQQINGAEQRMTAIRGELSKLAAQRAALTPWRELDLPLETQSTGQVEIQLGTLPGNLPFAQAEQAAREAGELTQLTLVSADREQQYALLVSHASQSGDALDKLKALGWSRANLRDWTGTAAENLARLDQTEHALTEEQKKLEADLAGLGGQRAQLEQLADRSEAEMNREAARDGMLDTSQTFFLNGWVSAQDWPRVEEMLAPYPCAWSVTDPAPEDYPKVPVRLKNNWLTRPLSMVTEMYSLPAYGSLDPNPLMAPFFILFYGIMMADMGYGLVMFLLGFLVLKKKKPEGTLAHMCGLLTLCGVSTFLMGALTGGFFGDFLTQLFKLTGINDSFALPALFTPLDDTMMILIGAMCLGFVQILTGMAISFYKKLRDGQVMDAVWEEVTWWVVFAGIALAALNVTKLVLLLGGAMVVAGPVMTEKGLGKLTGIFGSLYNHITGCFGDILSYSRLMALMLAGSVIAQVFNTLGAIPGNLVIFLVISLVGNTLNFALNLLGCYVHDLRLQCLEYFNKFYQDGGKPFRPLNFHTKYYDVVKD